MGSVFALQYIFGGIAVLFEKNEEKAELDWYTVHNANYGN